MPLPKDVANSMAVSNSVMLFWMLLVEFKDDWRNDGRIGMASSTLLLMVTQVHPSDMAFQMASDFGWVVLRWPGEACLDAAMVCHCTAASDGQVACRQIKTKRKLKAIYMGFRIAHGGLAFLTIDGCKMTT